MAVTVLYAVGCGIWLSPAQYMSIIRTLFFFMCVFCYIAKIVSFLRSFACNEIFHPNGNARLNAYRQIDSMEQKKKLWIEETWMNYWIQCTSHQKFVDILSTCNFLCVPFLRRSFWYICRLVVVNLSLTLNQKFCHCWMAN